MQTMKRGVLVLLFSFIATFCPAEESEIFHFAIVNPEIGNPRTVLSSFKTLMDWMSGKIKKKIVVTIYDDVDQTIKALDESKIDAGYIGMLDFFLVQTQTLIQPMITIVRDDSTTYTSCLLVRIADREKKIADFKKAKFGFTSFHRAIGGFYPQLYLLENGFDPDIEKFFSVSTAYFSDITALTDLIKGVIDICAVTKATLKTLQITSPGIVKNVHILDELEGLMYAPFFYRNGLDPTLRDKVIEESLAFSKTIEGRQLLMMFKVDGLRAISDNDYHTDRERARKLGYLKPKK